MASPSVRVTQKPLWYDDPERGCADPGNVLFFAPDLEEHRKFDASPAKRLCSTCPFKIDCLEWALDHNQRYGVWGGMDERQRRAIQRCRKEECNSRCTHPYRHKRRRIIR